MHNSVMQFGIEVLTPNLITDQRILEVGSRDINGSLRQHCILHRPKMYIGVDMVPGAGVDIVMDATDLHTLFAPNAFDVVICTEMLEHCYSWYQAISSMHHVLRPDGHLLLTTRGPGFPRHDYPSDYWRFKFGRLCRYLYEVGFEGMGSSRPDNPDTPGALIWAQKSLNRYRGPMMEPDEINAIAMPVY